MRASKKSQMEILGLAIIIALIAIGVLFVVKFVLLQPKPEIKAEFTQSQLTANMLNVLTRSTTDNCYRASIGELMQDCVKAASIDCEPAADGTTLNSCEYLNNLLEDDCSSAGNPDSIFCKILIAWNKPFYFYTSSTEISPITYLSCSKNEIGAGKPYSQIEQKQVYLPTTSGTLTLTLQLCS